MHEASIAQSIIDTVERWRSVEEIGDRIATIFLRIGKLTCVVPENLRFIFSALTESTALEGVRLEIEEVPVRGRCRACGARFDIVEPYFLCKSCRSPEVEIASGKELIIEAVEVI